MTPQELDELTLVADLPKGGTIVLAHPGQVLNRDPKFLKENYGITPDLVIRRSQSRERHLTPAEKDAERAATTKSREERIAELEAELALLRGPAAKGSAKV